jgi:hypothetical protein
MPIVSCPFSGMRERVACNMLPPLHGLVRIGQLGKQLKKEANIGQ